MNEKERIRNTEFVLKQIIMVLRDSAKIGHAGWNALIDQLSIQKESQKKENTKPQTMYHCYNCNISYPVESSGRICPNCKEKMSIYIER